MKYTEQEETICQTVEKLAVIKGRGRGVNVKMLLKYVGKGKLMELTI